MEASKMSLRHLLSAELRLDPRQWGPAPRRNAGIVGEKEEEENSRCPAILEVDSLVHEDWLRGASTTGVLPPPITPPLPAEEMHWLLQPSCDCSTPDNWLRVSILCLLKASDTTTNSTAKRFLIPQERGYSKTSIHELLTQISQENLLGSWQEVLQKAHPPSSTSHQYPTNSYVREVVHKLYHTKIKTIRQGNPTLPTRRHSTPRSTESLPLLPPRGGEGGGDSFTTTTTTATSQKRTPDDDRKQTHSNLSPLLTALEGRYAFYLIFPYSRFTLFDIALHSPSMFNDSISKPLFVLYQLLKALEHCHGVGVTLGPLSLRSVFVDSRLWVLVRPPGESLCLVPAETAEKEEEEGVGGGVKGVEVVSGEKSKKDRARERKKAREMRARRVPKVLDTPSVSSSTITTVSDPECEVELSESAKDTSSETSPVKQPSAPGSPTNLISSSGLQTFSNSPAIPLSQAVKLWQHGGLDNLTYLLLLNQHAGRRVGDANNHPIFPWVSDFTHPNCSFRDLSKSKFRLNKGDDQLNFTYQTAREEARRGGGDSDSSPTPHHVGDILTDVTYYVYKARQTPREVLCAHVRPRWVPEEYPSSMEKMYIWTPDECIPEFFTDPQIFRSIHSDLPDLILPAWCDSPEGFITAHRRLLEGDYVSSQLHNWIDLTFGYKLSGEAAVRSKNVYISLVDKHKNPKNHGIVQLFRGSHPKRVLGGCASTALLEWESYLGQSHVSSGASFPIDRQEIIARLARGSVSLGGPGTSGGGVSGVSGVSNQRIRTLESIVEQQTRKLKVQVNGEELKPGGGDEEEQEEVVMDGCAAEEPSHLDSSFEQISFPNDSLPSTAPSSFPNITYSDSPLDTTLAVPSASALGKTASVRFKETTGGAVMNAAAQLNMAGQKGFRVGRYFRQRKPNQSDGSGDEYPWQGMEISLPRDGSVMRRLLEHEERAHFVLKSCKDFSDSLGPLWDQEHLQEMVLTTSSPPLPPLLVLLDRINSDPDYSPSQEERVMIDVASVVVTIVEFCCIRELRVSTRIHASLKERVEVIRRTVSASQIKLPSYLRSLVELILVPDSLTTKNPFSSSNSHLSISASLLLQPFLPVVSFPAYFDLLHRFASALELHSRLAGFSNEPSPKPLSPSEPLSVGELDPRVVTKMLDSVSENINSLVSSTASGEGFVLLLLHLYPLFQYHETSFEMVQNHLELLGQHMSHAQMSRLFSGILVNFYDSPFLLPHQHGFLLSRAMADFTIRHFGLSNFLSKFLVFFLEAVLEPDRLSGGVTSGNSSGVRKNLFRLKETESILTLVNEIGGGGGVGAGGGGGDGSIHYDDQKRQSHVSEFTFSVDLSEAGRRVAGYQSDGESSSEGDSAGEAPPEAAASLLARGGMSVLGSVGSAMYNINEEEEEERVDRANARENEKREGSLKTMFLSQFAYGDPESPDSNEWRKSRKIDRSMSVREPDNSRSGPELLQQQALTSSLRLTTSSQDGVSGSRETVANKQTTPLDDESFPTVSTGSQSDPLYTSDFLPTVNGMDSPRAMRENGEIEDRGNETGKTGKESEKSWKIGGEWEEEEEEEEEEDDEMVTDEKKKKEGEGGEEAGKGEGGAKMDDKPSNDPETVAINLRLAEIAGDTLCWLINRLGPLLATSHIINPLLTGMHRCYNGVLGQRTKHRAVLKCLEYMAELYGDRVLIKLYLSRVDGWVASATHRMSVKTESNLAASLSLVKLVTRQLSDQRLEEITPSLCEGFFIPLIQLLSSQAIFPSGSQARATICHSLVLLLLSTGRRLGREKCPHLLLETLRLFFTCFDGVYATRLEEEKEEDVEGFVTTSSRFSSQTSAPGKISTGRRRSSTTSIGKDSSGVRTQENRLSKSKKKAISLDQDTTTTKNKTIGSRIIENMKNAGSTHDLALQQLQETFTPAMAHATYIPFCKLLGQIKVNTELRNTELIEHMAYSHDDRTKQENQQLPSVFLDDRSSSSDSESEDLSTDNPSRGMDDDLARDVTIKLGPIGALQQKRGLGGNDIKFSRTTWFVDLYGGVGGEIGGASAVPGSGGDSLGLERGNEGLVATVTGVTSGGGVSGGAGGMGLTAPGEGSSNMSKSISAIPGGGGGGGGGGEEGGGGGGGKGWMDGVRGSAYATATGILGLIQNRPLQEGKGSKVDELTRHSMNFDLKFQLSSSHGNNSTDGCEEVNSHLEGQWSELWESRLHQSPHHSDNYSNFMGKRLQIYTGHKSTIRSLAVSNSEHFFLSASKDKTVKLWLLRNQGGGSAQIPAHLTYSQHQKPVSQVKIVSTTGDILSCDGSVHLWDPEYGHLIHQYSSPRGREFVAMTTLLPPQQVAIVATNDSVLRFIDFRTHTLQHSWKIHLSTGGILRSLVCGDSWVAVGNIGGVVSTLELRMGGLLHQWRPSDYNLVPSTTWNENLSQLMATCHCNLVTSVGSGILHLWRPSTGKLLAHIRGQSSTTPCLDVMGEQLISVSSGGQFVIHNSFERTKDPSSSLLWSSKVRSKELKGGVASVATLQEKRLVLLGSENGQAVLMS